MEFSEKQLWNCPKIEGAFVREILSEYISQKEDAAYKSGYQKGYKIALSALYEAYESIADDEKIVALLTKYWGVNQEEANRDLFLEKRDFARKAVGKYLQSQGKSPVEIQIYLEIELDRHSDLWIYWREPEKLVNELNEKSHRNM